MRRCRLTSWVPVTVRPGTSTARFWNCRAEGMLVMMALSITCCRRALCTSTIGLTPLTVIVSWTPPTRICVFTVAVSEPDSSMPSCWTVPKPVNVKVTAYTPAGRSMTRYRPVPSLTTERTRSIKAGLDTSTVTPGNTAPDVSLTTPVIDARTVPWAEAQVGGQTPAMSTQSAVSARSASRSPSSAGIPVDNFPPGRTARASENACGVEDRFGEVCGAVAHAAASGTPEYTRVKSRTGN